MKRLIIVAFLISFIKLEAAELKLEGFYQGKNLYVINPFSDLTNTSFCVTEVIVNGTATRDEIQSSSFEIDLAALNLKQGEKLTVRIGYKEGCKPKVVNPEVLQPTASFVIISIKADATTLKWSTRNEMGSLPFIVEEFRWNSWRKIDEVPGLGTPEKASYDVSISPHSGINKYRISQVDYTKKPVYSKKQGQYITPANIPEVTYTVADKGTKIKFSAITVYQIYDGTGKFIKEGTDKEADISDLEKGKYHLYYDDKTEDFTKK
ncbi:MAG: hypothetical protein WCL14_11680 [Bacteroidota bacterium]